MYANMASSEKLNGDHVSGDVGSHPRALGLFWVPTRAKFIREERVLCRQAFASLNNGIFGLGVCRSNRKELVNRLSPSSIVEIQPRIGRRIAEAMNLPNTRFTRLATDIAVQSIFLDKSGEFGIDTL